METTLNRASEGDEDAFRDLVAPYTRELHVHCYRMLGSLADAEDIVQETLVAAWGGLDDFAGRSSLRSWLYRIATNRCLNAIRDAKRRPPLEPVPPFTPPVPSRWSEVPWLQPYPDALLDQAPDLSSGPETRYQIRETIELAFIVALQHLPPRQAAALLLRDVVGFAAAEVADMLGTSPTVVKGLLQRARGSVDQRRGIVAGGRVLTNASGLERELAERFASAFVAGDIDTLVGLLTDNAWLAMPPAPHEYCGPAAIAGFLEASAGWRRRRGGLVPTRANGQPAFGYYLADLNGSGSRAVSVLVLTLSHDGINGITHFLDRDLPRMFGLPERID